MITSTYEPSWLETGLTRALGIFLRPYYKGFVNSLNLEGDEHVLDFGSGSGACSRHIADQLQDEGLLECVDVSQKWMAVLQRSLKRHQNVRYHCGHIDKLDLPDGTFDLIVLHYVLHDIPAGERPEVLGELVRTLRPGGRLVLREPQLADGLLENLKEVVAGHPGEAPVYVDLVTERGSQVVVRATDKLKIRPDGDCLGDLDRLLGAGRVALKGLSARAANGNGRTRRGGSRRRRSGNGGGNGNGTPF